MTRLGLVRSGGFAGLRREVTVDTETHPDGPWFDGEVSALDLASLGDLLIAPQEASPAAPGADRFQYVLSVETHASSHLLRFGEEVPAPLSPLVDRMLGPTGESGVGEEEANPG